MPFCRERIEHHPCLFCVNEDELEWLEDATDVNFVVDVDGESESIKWPCVALVSCALDIIFI